MEENGTKTERNEDGTFINHAGPGRPTGQKNYSTLYREALIKIAKLNGKEPEELELDIISQGLNQARKGNFAFYRDTLDRLHGKPKQDIEMDVTLTSKIISVDE